MRIFVTAIMILTMAGFALAADRDTMPVNPNAYDQPADWSDGLQGHELTVELGRDTTVYSDLASFLAVIGSTYFFDDFSWCDWQTVSGPTWTFGPVNGYSYTASSPGDLFSVPGAMSTNAANDILTLEFDGAPVTAVGGDFFVTDFDGNPVPGTTIVTLVDGTVVSVDYPTVFAGFTSDVPIASLVISTESLETVYVAYDNFYVGEMGTVATEPASLTSVKTLFE